MAKENIPIFEQKVGIKPGPVAKVGASFEKLANVLQDFSDKSLQVTQRISDELSAKRGAEAGRSLDFEPKTPVTETDRAFEQAALQANKVAVSTNVRDKIKSIEQETLDPANFNQNSLEEYQRKISGFSAGLLQNVPKSNQDAVKNVINYYAINGQNRVISRTQAVDKQKLHAGLLSSLNKFQHDSENAAFSGDGASGAALFSQGKRTLQMALDSGLVSGSFSAETTERWQSELQQQSYLGQFSRAIDDGTPQEYLRKFSKSKSTDLTEPERLNLHMKMEGMLRQKRTSISIKGEDLNNEINDELVRVQHGAKPDLTLSSKIREFFPKKYGAYTDDINAAKLYSTASTQLKYVSPLDRQAILEKFKPKLNESGIAKKEQVFSKIEQLNREQLTQFTKDPAGYIQDSPAVENAVNQFSTLGKGDPFQTMINAQKEMGLTDSQVRLISNVKAAAYVTRIKTDPIAKQVSDIKSIADEYGKHANVALRDLSRAGLPMANQLVISMSNNPSSLSLVPQAVEAFETPMKDLVDALPDKKTKSQISSLVKGHLEQYNSTVAVYNGPTSTLTANLNQHVLRIAMKLAQTETVEKAARDAANAAINDHFSYDTVNGETYRYPKSMDGELVNNSARTLLFQAENSKLRIPPYFFPNLSTRQREIEYRKEISAKGHVVTLPDNGGITAVDGSGVPIKTQTGNPFTTRFSDLLNAQSEERHRVDSARQTRALKTAASRGQEARFIDPFLTSQETDTGELG